MTLHFTNLDQAEYERLQKQVHFHSKLGFLNAHNGLRRGCLHLLIGTTSGGKSTLMRTLMRDILFHPLNDCHIGIWLSEEEVNDYKAQLALSVPSHDRLLKTEAFSEMEMKTKSEMAFFEWLHFHKPDVFIFDNITTSAFYMDMKPDSQAKFATKLKAITKELNMATILVAHTEASVSDSQKGLISINQIRGSKSICNLAEFAYILQRFETDNDFFPTLRIVKSRSQTLVHNLYFLDYDKRLRAHAGDRALEFSKFKEAYGNRNRLD